MTRKDLLQNTGEINEVLQGVPSDLIELCRQDPRLETIVQSRGSTPLFDREVPRAIELTSLATAQTIDSITKDFTREFPNISPGEVQKIITFQSHLHELWSRRSLFLYLLNHAHSKRFIPTQKNTTYLQEHESFLRIQESIIAHYTADNIELASAPYNDIGGNLFRHYLHPTVKWIYRQDDSIAQSLYYDPRDPVELYKPRAYALFRAVGDIYAEYAPQQLGTPSDSLLQ